MREFRGKTAVVTGAASGIGRALALRCAEEGMSVAIADVDEAGLEETGKQISLLGAQVVAVPTDVSKIEAVEALARRACDAFGGVHLVFNNAGVLVSGCSWERSAADWEWVLGVNLFGAIHGARAFLPMMIETRTIRWWKMTHLIRKPIQSNENRMPSLLAKRPSSLT